jgi:hypothetical protein
MRIKITIEIVLEYYDLPVYGHFLLIAISKEYLFWDTTFNR